MPVLYAVSSGLFVKHTSTSHSFSSTSVTCDCCLQQRTPLNSVRSLKLQRLRYVFVGFNRTHLIMLTISVITAGQLSKQLIIDVIMLYRYWVWFRIKTTMDLIAISKGLIAQSKEAISL